MGSTTWRLGGVKVLMERRGGEGGQREGLEPERSDGGGGHGKRGAGVQRIYRNLGV